MMVSVRGKDMLFCGEDCVRGYKKHRMLVQHKLIRMKFLCDRQNDLKMCIKCFTFLRLTSPSHSESSMRTVIKTLVLHYFMAMANSTKIIFDPVLTDAIDHKFITKTEMMDILKFAIEYGHKGCINKTYEYCTSIADMGGPKCCMHAFLNTPDVDTYYWTLMISNIGINDDRIIMHLGTLV